MELDRLTTPPRGAGLDWLDVQIREVAALNERIQHGIKLETRWTESMGNTTNCYMHAFNLPHEAIAKYRCDIIQPDRKFVSDLIITVLEERIGNQIIAIEGDIVIYCDEKSNPKHAGRMIGKKVRSKWGDGCTHIWIHGLWEVPIRYGNTVRYFRPLSQERAVSAYIDWAQPRL
jgi:hypothetical protein